MRIRSGLCFVVESIGSVLWGGAFLIFYSSIAIADDLSIPSFADVRSAYVPSYAWLLDRSGEKLSEKRLDFHVRRLEWLGLKELSPAIQEILIASEDRGFYRHSGVDWAALAASAWFNFWHFQDGKHPRGASTLTMQLAGFIDPTLKPRGGRRTMTQKWNQLRSALALEKKWSKPEILEAYLNLAPFRGEIVGINGISRALFDKSPSALDRAESLLLVALLRGTGATPQQVAKRACRIPGALQQGITCAALREIAINRFAQVGQQMQRNDLAPHLAQKLLVEPGSRVFTTLDANLQRFAIQSLQEHLSVLQQQDVSDGAVVVIDNASGDVLAYVGSNKMTSEASSVDGVQALRQAGSTLKPFLYGIAIEDRLLTAASVLDDSPVQLMTPSGLYIPQNYEHDFKGLVTVRTALASSLNIPAVRTLGLVGVDRFVQRLKLSGLDSLTRDGKFYGLGLALGDAEVRLLKLTNAYRVLADAGIWRPYRFTMSEQKTAPYRVLSTQAAFIVADILSDSGARSATFGLDNPLVTRGWAAVKTGTSKDMRDNWCIGFSDSYTVGVWVGNFSGEPMKDVSGITGAAPVWRDIIDYLHSNRQSIAPSRPLGLIEQQVRFVPEIESTRAEWFIKGTEAETIRVASSDQKGMLPKILYPDEGTVIAIDPDIPADYQRIRFNAHSASSVNWLLDGSVIGNTSTAWWMPSPGHHQLLLTDRNGRELDKVNFEVRGDPVTAEDR